jgi:hypothetical protein
MNNPHRDLTQRSMRLRTDDRDFAAADRPTIDALRGGVSSYDGGVSSCDVGPVEPASHCSNAQLACDSQRKVDCFGTERD